MTLNESTSEDAQTHETSLAPVRPLGVEPAATESTARLGDIWLLEDGIYSAHLQVLPADEVDDDRESQVTWADRFAAMRDGGHGHLANLTPMWRRALRSTLMLTVLSIAAVATVAVGIFAATRIGSSIHPTVPPSSVDKRANQNGVVIVPSDQNAQPTPAPSDYLIGVWTSQSNPPAGGVATTFVRVTYKGQPLAKVPVSLEVTIGGSTRTYPPVTTDAFGLALFQVSLGGASSGRPVYLTGRYKVSSDIDVESNVIIVPG